MSEFTSPGPFRHKTACVAAVLAHGSGAEDQLTQLSLILPFGSCWNWTDPNTIAILALGLHTGDFCDPIQVSLNRCVGGSTYISGCKRERNKLVAT